jgi:hypothetical protein
LFFRNSRVPNISELETSSALMRFIMASSSCPASAMPSVIDFAYLLFRTQLFNPADLKNVKRIQAGYRAQTLSQYLKQTAPPASPAKLGLYGNSCLRCNSNC